MTTPRPRCVHCSKPYGLRYTVTEEHRHDAGKEPLPYRGNGIVVKETKRPIRSEGVIGEEAIVHEWLTRRQIWDGETWWTHYEPFCALHCALDYARKAYARSKIRAVA